MTQNTTIKPAKLWGMLKNHHKITAQHTVEIQPVSMWDADALFDAIAELCTALDIARPVVLRKHASDMQAFSRAVFKKADFVEKVKFDAFEVELLQEDKDSQDKNSRQSGGLHFSDG